ncbi:MAG: hypothetical protein WCQ47_06405 [bacterium]
MKRFLILTLVLLSSTAIYAQSCSDGGLTKKEVNQGVWYTVADRNGTPFDMILIQSDVIKNTATPKKETEAKPTSNAPANTTITITKCNTKTCDSQTYHGWGSVDNR